MHELLIEPGRAEKNYWRDLWRYRELFYFLAWRDILVRYKHTVIGIAWAVARPFLMMVVFTMVFGRIAQLLAAMLPWQFFASSLTESRTPDIGVTQNVRFLPQDAFRIA